MNQLTFPIKIEFQRNKSSFLTYMCCVKCISEKWPIFWRWLFFSPTNDFTPLKLTLFFFHRWSMLISLNKHMGVDILLENFKTLLGNLFEVRKFSLSCTEWCNFPWKRFFDLKILIVCIWRIRFLSGRKCQFSFCHWLKIYLNMIFCKGLCAVTFLIKFHWHMTGDTTLGAL